MSQPAGYPAWSLTLLINTAIASSTYNESHQGRTQVKQQTQHIKLRPWSNTINASFLTRSNREDTLGLLPFKGRHLPTLSPPSSEGRVPKITSAVRASLDPWPFVEAGWDKPPARPSSAPRINGRALDDNETVHSSFLINESVRDFVENEVFFFKICPTRCSWMDC